MARATGKTNKHKRQRPGSLAKVKRSRRKHAKVVERFRWETEGHFTDPVIYVYDPGTSQLGRRIGGAMWLPELIGLLLKAVDYFEIDGRPDGPKRPLPSRETLKTFFAYQKLSDGSCLSPRLVDVMATLCLPLQLMKGGRPRKGQPSSPLEDLHEGSSARDRERVLLRLISGDEQPAPSDEEAEKH
jgi:hypothetical protein